MIPVGFRMLVRRSRNAVAAARLTVAQRARWRAIAETPPRAALAVSYGVASMPAESEVVFGGAVKFQLLDRELPNARRDFNVLYLGSSSLPLDARPLVRLARRRGAAFAWNQNGVAYRGWYGDGWELVNRPRARLLHAADHVFFQSAFCKLAADRFYGERTGPWEILHNPVDVERFMPPIDHASRPLTLLLGGNQYQGYRVMTALETLAELRRDIPDVRLLVSGTLSSPADVAAAVRSLGLGDAVELVGPYSHAQAPELMRRADLLLHTKYNDPCPTVVLEAMACGLPVVYSASGGTPELVGDEAGIGVPAPLDWDTDHPPGAEELARAAARITADLPRWTAAARSRSERFDARPWVARHRAVFEDLLGRSRRDARLS